MANVGINIYNWAADRTVKAILNLSSSKYRRLSWYNTSGPTSKYGFCGKLRALIIVQEVNDIWHTIDVPKLKRLKNIHSDKDRCFIMGSGPSINLLDLGKLKNEMTFGVNACYLNFDKMGFIPTYYVVEDNLVAEDRADEINRLRGMTKFFPIRLAYCLNRDEDTIFFNHCPDITACRFSTDISQFTCGGSTVVFTCLQIAYYMGFKKVYLIGMDHNYVIPERYRKYNPNLNYIIYSTEDDSSHFHKDYFGRGYRWHNPKSHLMEKAYKIAKRIYNEDGRCIYNASKGGKLELFKRVSYEDLFS